MSIQCTKPISDIVHGLKCTTKANYRHLSKINVKQTICSGDLATTRDTCETTDYSQRQDMIYKEYMFIYSVGIGC